MPSPRPPRELFFVDRPSEAPDGITGIDLARGAARSDSMFALAQYYRRHEAEWKAAFVAWLGRANVENASLGWWAHTTSAKNFLSSPLGNQLFQVLALGEALKDTDTTRAYVAGATSGQIALLDQLLARSASDWRVFDRRRRRAPRYYTLARLAYHFGRVLGCFILRRPKRVFSVPPEVCLLTYVDRGFRDGGDAFFGSLATLLAPHLRTVPRHVAFLQAPYLEMLPKLEGTRAFEYWPLYAELRLADLLWAASRTVAAMTHVSRWSIPPVIADLDASALLRESLRWDLAKGGYFYNLLVRRAMERLVRRTQLARIIYPFENKSLEKMLIIGARAGRPTCRLVGYQHTSITPRHTTFLLAPGEADATPLPDRVVTVGDVTRDYLEERGNYPADLFVTGGALRQTWRDPFEAAPPARDRPLRVLLALSSSGEELRGAVELARSVADPALKIEWGIRPHPEFPLSILPADLQSWVAEHARDLSGTQLAENIAWCDMVVYVSSTVALEALMLGRPVVNVRLDDSINPDPVLGATPFHSRASSPAELISCIGRIASLPETELNLGQSEGRAYVAAYLRPLAKGEERRFLA